MTRIPTIRPWVRKASKPQYDAFVAAVGYERRSRHIAEDLGIEAQGRFACAFPDRKIHSYDENHKWYVESGYEVEEVTDEAFGPWCDCLIESVTSKKSARHHIGVDISSLNRTRLAMIVDSLRKSEKTIKVDFLYSLAEYSPPPKHMTPNRHFGPVLRNFSGWTSEPDLPPVAILGLGYERDKALGAAEHVQAAKIWAFLPESPIPKYADAVRRSNRLLLENIPSAQQLFFPVHQPADCFVLLESFTHRLASSSCPVFFPLGPKIFALCSLLVACLYPEVAIWRISSGAEGEAIERFPSGLICGLSADFAQEV